MPAKRLLATAVLAVIWRSSSEVGANFLSKSALMDGKIIGGSPLNIEQAPFAVQLEFYSSKTRHWKVFCGGSLLNKDHVLTAGHCANEFRNTPQVLRVRAGTALAVLQGGRMSLVKSVIMHPKYSEGADGFPNYDAAVLELSSAIRVGGSVQTVQLVGQGQAPATGRTVRVAGWGVTEASQTAASKRLMSASFTVMDHGSCASIYEAYGQSVQRFLCLTALKAGTTCKGDSGSAAYVPGPKPLQVGLVSWGSCSAFDPVLVADLSDTEIHTFIQNNSKP